MTREERELLLKDISSRLPYGVKVQRLSESEIAFELYSINIESTEIQFFKYRGKGLEICDRGLMISPNGFVRFKPYLRPMNSMTREECNEYGDLCHIEVDAYANIYRYDTVESIDWLNKKMFDYRGLIEKGLALEAPEDMYKLG